MATTDPRMGLCGEMCMKAHSMGWLVQVIEDNGLVAFLFRSPDGKQCGGQLMKDARSALHESCLEFSKLIK